KKVFPLPPPPKNSSHFRGKVFPLKTPFHLFLKPFLGKRVSDFPKTFLLGTFLKKGSVPPKTFET
ncbi:MAG: hypothetical protein D6805_06365, partial [Planctomycetota bacterium]